MGSPHTHGMLMLIMPCFTVKLPAEFIGHTEGTRGGNGLGWSGILSWKAF